jgi:hypothetical protein
MGPVKRKHLEKKKRKTREERGVYAVSFEVDERFASKLQKLSDTLGITKTSIAKLALHDMFSRHNLNH